jgi:hypothetical protein
MSSVRENEMVRLRLQLEDAAVNRALARARFHSATPDGMENGKWLRMVAEYHHSIRQWEIAEDAFISHIRTYG